MSNCINGLGVVWVLASILTGGGGLLLLLGDDFGLVIFAEIAAFVLFTGGIVLMGFAIIVKYFEIANRKRSSGNKQR